MKEKQESQQVVESTLMDTSSVLKVRLDAHQILKRVKTFLTGKIQSVLYDEEGKAYFHEEKIAEPKANPEGIQWIQNYVENIVNAQAVQGNFDFDQYQIYVAEVHEGLYYNLMNNLHLYDINEDEFEPIVDIIMNLLQPFLSRLIDNEERKSYAQSIQVKESSNVSSSGGLFRS